MIDVSSIKPLEDYSEQLDSSLSGWVDGSIFPAQNGLYLREFDEGEAVSEFYGGVWLRDSFFPSDIQNARWRGMRHSIMHTSYKGRIAWFRYPQSTLKAIFTEHGRYIHFMFGIYVYFKD
jgi:hypothetical protein